jgi:hypothetical protein
MRKSALRVLLTIAVCLVLALAMAGTSLAWHDVGPTELGDYGLSAGQLEQISQGYPDGSWRPYSEMTRSQFVKMAVAAWGVPTVNPGAPSYLDVPKDDPYYQYVEALTAAELVTGVGGDRFDPSGKITREQAAAVIARWMAQVAGYDLETYFTPTQIGSILSRYSDGDQVSTPLREELAFATEWNVIRGAGGVLAPRAALWRIQGAALLLRSAVELHADMVIKNAKVLTVDQDFSVEEAIAVRNGIVVFVGTDEDADAWIGSDTQVLDLGGKVIMPGVNDSHGHATALGMSLPPLQLDLTTSGGTTTLAQVQAKVQERVAQIVSEDEWIQGRGWDPWLFPDVTRYDLDAVAPNNPVALIDMSEHNMWVNSKALELAGITKDTLDPEGGTIIRDASGEPTGMLRELSAVALVKAVIPAASDHQLAEAAVAAMTIMNEQGVTSITEAALSPSGDSGGFGSLEVYKDLYDQDKLTVRVTALMLFGTYGGFTFDDLKTGVDTFPWDAPIADPNWLRVAGVKIFADGIPVTYTSWLWEPYVGDFGSGSLTIPGASDQEKYDQLVAMIRYVHARNIQLGVHATGDRAISAVLDGIALAQDDHPEFSNTRDYIIHGELITPADAVRAAGLNIGVNMQPVIQGMIADIEPFFIGPERAAYEWPFNTVFSAGIPMTASSDTPVTFPNWRQGMQAMVLREGYMSGLVSGPDERVTREQAVRAYTINGAIQDKMDDIKGSIERGKLADFCILEKDIMTVDPHELTDTSVLMTIVGGSVVYDNSAGAFLK